MKDAQPAAADPIVLERSGVPSDKGSRGLTWPGIVSWLVARIDYLWRHAGIFIVLIVIWFLSDAARGDTQNIGWVGPIEVWSTAGTLIADGTLPTYIAESLSRLLLGQVIAIVIGMLLGLGLALSKVFRAAVYPLVNFFQAISGIAIIPLLLIWFGFSTETIIIAINYNAVFPMIAGTMNGVRTIPPAFRDAMVTLGAGDLRILRDVVLPGTMVDIVTGVRLSFAYGWRALIAAEIIVGANGLGFLIFYGQESLDTGVIFLGMIVIGAIWVGIDALLLSPVERLTIERWGSVSR